MPRKVPPIVTSRRARLLRSTKPASRPLKRVLSGTSTPPAAWRPTATTGHSQRLGAHNATRSPGSTPAARNARAARSACWANEAKPSRSGPSSRNGASPKRSAASRASAGIVRAAKGSSASAVGALTAGLLAYETQRIIIPAPPALRAAARAGGPPRPAATVATGVRVQLRFSDEDEAFRREVQAWLAAHLTGPFAALRGRGGPGDEHAMIEERRAWERR